MDNSRENYAAKKYYFTGIPNLTIIVPSQWLKGLVQQSFLQEYPVEVVYHTINTEVFKPTPSEFRKQYGLEGKKMILGVANVWTDRKGIQDFVALSELVDENCRIVLVGLSEEQIRALPAKILGLPRTTNVTQLAEIYTAADVYVNPSVEETFGLTTLEAQHCGTSAIVYQGTACEEIVNQFGGIAVPRGAASLWEGICRILKSEEEKREN